MLDNYHSNINEILNIRHVLVHNDGIIDEQFLKRVKYSDYERGKKVLLDESLMNDVINNIHNYMTILDRELKKTVFLTKRIQSLKLSRIRKIFQRAAWPAYLSSEINRGLSDFALSINHSNVSRKLGASVMTSIGYEPSTPYLEK